MILKWDYLGDARNQAHMHTLNIIFGILVVKKSKDPIIVLNLVISISTPYSSLSITIFKAMGVKKFFKYRTSNFFSNSKQYFV